MFRNFYVFLVKCVWYIVRASPVVNGISSCGAYDFRLYTTMPYSISHTCSCQVVYHICIYQVVGHFRQVRASNYICPLAHSNDNFIKINIFHLLYVIPSGMQMTKAWFCKGILPLWINEVNATDSSKPLHTQNQIWRVFCKLHLLAYFNINLKHSPPKNILFNIFRPWYTYIYICW